MAFDLELCRRRQSSECRDRDIVVAKATLCVRPHGAPWLSTVIHAVAQTLQCRPRIDDFGISPHVGSSCLANAKLLANQRNPLVIPVVRLSRRNIFSTHKKAKSIRRGNMGMQFSVSWLQRTYRSVDRRTAFANSSKLAGFPRLVDPFSFPVVSGRWKSRIWVDLSRPTRALLWPKTCLDGDSAL